MADHNANPTFPGSFPFLPASKFHRAAHTQTCTTGLRYLRYLAFQDTNTDAERVEQNWSFVNYPRAITMPAGARHATVESFADLHLFNRPARRKHPREADESALSVQSKRPHAQMANTTELATTWLRDLLRALRGRRANFRPRNTPYLLRKPSGFNRHHTCKLLLVARPARCPRARPPSLILTRFPRPPLADPDPLLPTPQTNLGGIFPPPLLPTHYRFGRRCLHIVAALPINPRSRPARDRDGRLPPSLPPRHSRST
ncbi:hypothetical protein DFH06DRAFT_1342945 [Mycena polygramma]|nr:hypothetical protein DFH06DRAFT_1342945 [Mycena polygramma]